MVGVPRRYSLVEVFPRRVMRRASEFSMPTERRRVHYSGRVQGVGFRFTSQRLAERYAVTGYVRNLPDGRVELVAEGEPATLNAFLAAVQSALGAKIHSVSIESEPSGEPPFEDFSIR
jgi:acylphosphatase